MRAAPPALPSSPRLSPSPRLPPSPRLWFTGFWHKAEADAIRAENDLYRLLARSFDVRLDARDPDFLLYSFWDYRHYHYACPRICWTGENKSPDFRECDWAFSFEPTRGRNFHLPFWSLLTDPQAMPPPPANLRAELARKTRFCAFVYWNPHAPTRNLFYKILSQYKPVDAAGEVYQNCAAPSPRYAADWVARLTQYYRRCKFVIAFENCSAEGYTTEKLALPLMAHAVPIYWGNPHAARHFHPQAFINAHDFDSLESLARYVQKVDQDDALYRRYLAAPKYVNGRVPRDADWQVIAARFARIFATSVTPVAERDPWRWSGRRFWPRGLQKKFGRARRAQSDVRQRCLQKEFVSPLRSQKIVAPDGAQKSIAKAR